METDFYRPLQCSLNRSLQQFHQWWHHCLNKKGFHLLVCHWGLKTKECDLAAVSRSSSVGFESIICSMCLDWYYKDLPTLFETHFLNTSDRLILSASFLWAEKPGIINMRGNYTQQEVPTKRFKQTVGVYVCSCCSCTSHSLSPSLAAVFIFLFDPSIYPQLCAFMCAHMHTAVGVWLLV